MIDGIEITKKYVLDILKLRREYKFENAMKVAQNVLRTDNNSQSAAIMIFGILGEMFAVIVNACEECKIPDDTIADIVVDVISQISVLAGLDKPDRGGEDIMKATAKGTSILSQYMR